MVVVFSEALDGISSDLWIRNRVKKDMVWFTVFFVCLLFSSFFALNVLVLEEYINSGVFGTKSFLYISLFTIYALIVGFEYYKYRNLCDRVKVDVILSFVQGKQVGIEKITGFNKYELDLVKRMSDGVESVEKEMIDKIF